MPDEIDEPHIGIREYHALEDSHAHDYHQILLPLRGTLGMETGGREGLAGGNAGVVIPRSATHRFWCEDKSQFLVIDLPAESLEIPKKSQSGFFSLSPALQHLTRFAELAVRENRYEDIRPLIIPLVTQVLKSDGFARDHQMVAQLSAACALIDRHFAEPLSYEVIADKSGLSVSRLISLFKRWMNCTPADYLSAVRLKEARQLLQASGHSIAEISHRCGFSEQSALTRAFKRQFGITPAAFRKTMETR
ncbi:helix-turn-helix transcriptional regulator [Aestuariispira insulae]|uniref:AraC family transcriptional regulator n=1 Tax=Aestuariispira insulae TaxID=1461337 RepID=A0A3D9HI63_9PROT|nr:AraC family transcriptional regulator [Aestuariispira insulae]RED49115.1 AraC family transcriptional regulator [Aestuariispira insulae]